MEYPTSDLYFLDVDSILLARVLTRKIQVTSGMFHGIPRESVALLFYAIPQKTQWWERCAAHNAKVGYHTEGYTTAFL